MEDQKKKYLLSRIKKEEQLIQSEYAKFRSIYQGKQMGEERNEPYLTSIAHLVELNNTFAAELIQYLEKNQIKAVFHRFNTIFVDLLAKYKNTYQLWGRLEKDKNYKEVRDICQICHEEIENNRIENIRTQIDRESETRAILIKNLIEETEKERVRPLFTEEEDRHFKEELEKVLRQKEMVLQTNITESSLFLEKIADDIANFMLQFKNDFGDWEVKPLKEGANWTKLMKNYVSQKLTGSFGQKMPPWIKRMHDVFVQNQPKKPKIYKCNKQIQTMEVPTQGEVKARKEADDMKANMAAQGEEMSKIKMESQRIKEVYQELKNVIRNLKSELEMRENELIEIKASQRMLSSHKDFKNDKEKVPTAKEITTFKDVEARASQKSMITAKKISKILSGQFSHNRINTQSITESNLENSRQNIQEELSEEEKEDKEDARVSIYEGASKQNLKSNPQREERPSEQEMIKKLKKKVYRGNTREQIIGNKPDVEKQVKKQHKQINSDVTSHPKLKQEVKKVEEQLKNSILMNNNSSQGSPNLKRYNSISVLQNNRNSRRNQSQIQTKHVSSHYKKQKFPKTSYCQTGIQTDFTEGVSSLAKKIKFKEEEGSSSRLVKNISRNLSLIREQLGEMGKMKEKSGMLRLSQINQMLEEYMDEHTVLLTQCHNQAKEGGDISPGVEDRQKAGPQKQGPIKIGGIRQSTNEDLVPQQPRLTFKEQTNQYKSSNMPKIVNKSQLKVDPSSYEQRRNKSLCVQKDHASKQNNLKLPKLSMHNESHSKEKESRTKSIKSSRVLNVINEQYALLFIDDKYAKKYEESFDELANKRERSRPTPTQFHLIEEMFAQLEVIKKNKAMLYGQIGTLLRYPLTQARNNFMAVNLVRSLAFEDFVNYFLKILWIHRKCSKTEPYHICEHIDSYQKKLKQMSTTAKIF